MMEDKTYQKDAGTKPAGSKGELLWDDSTMAIRMVEYDFAIALEQSVRNGRMYEMDFPESCVLYLRSSKIRNSSAYG